MLCRNSKTLKKIKPKENNKTLKYNYGEKPMKVPFVIYADLESLLEKMSTCYNNPKKSSTAKIKRHTPSGYSLFKHCSFDTTKNRLDYYRDKNCIIEQKYILQKLIIIEAKNTCLDLKKHVAKIINHAKKKINAANK